MGSTPGKKYTNSETVRATRMSKRARDAYPDKYAAAMARKRARLSTGTDVQSTRAIVRSEIKKSNDLKYTDAQVLAQNMTSSGNVVSLLAQLTRGDAGLNGFDGNSIQPKGLTVKYSISSNQSYNAVRVLIFQWTDSSAPAVSGVLQTTTTGLAPLSPILVTNKAFVRVLYDKTHMIAPTAGVPDSLAVNSVYGLATTYDSIYIPGNRIKKIKFNSNTNVVQDGNIFVLYISDDSVPSYPVMNLYSRLSFYD